MFLLLILLFQSNILADIFCYFKRLFSFFCSISEYYSKIIFKFYV